MVEAEERWRARVARLEASERRLRRMAAASKMAARAAKEKREKERQQLGRELHTGVGQLLAAVRVQAELIEHFLPERPAPVAQALERIGALAGEALEQVRAVSHGLYLPEWQRAPLPEAIAALWEQSGMAQRFGAPLRLTQVAGAAGAATKALVYRAAQEGISNVVRHSRATSAAVTLEEQGDRLVLTVEDNGVGFQTIAGKQRARGGMGLAALRDEAAALGAELAVETGSAGTKLKLSVPVEW